MSTPHFNLPLGNLLPPRCLLQLERAGRLEAGGGGEGMIAEDPLLLARVMEVREQIEDARVRPRV